MDNEQHIPLPSELTMPTVQPMSNAGLEMPGTGTQSSQNNGQTGLSLLRNQKGLSGMMKNIMIAVLGVAGAAFIGLFIWMTLQYNDVTDDLQGRIDQAVANAMYDQAVEMEQEFAEREKSPYRSFSGPVDYGQLSFKYPKTWSVYVAADARNGGDFAAYFNPVQVDAINEETIYALGVFILDRSYEQVVAEYNQDLGREEGGLDVESITVSGVMANLYTGTIPGTQLSGYIAMFKIRDKTAIFQTTSMLFKDDFDAVLQSVTFNA